MARQSTRLTDETLQLKKWLIQLEKIIPATFKEYESDFVISSACERLSERIIEQIIIISNVILKEKGVLKKEKCFETLSDLNLINKKLSKKLENLKGMRNLMIHNYGDFDEEIFYDSLKEILEDAYAFTQEISHMK